MLGPRGALDTDLAVSLFSWLPRVRGGAAEFIVGVGVAHTCGVSLRCGSGHVVCCRLILVPGQGVLVACCGRVHYDAGMLVLTENLACMLP